MDRAVEEVFPPGAKFSVKIEREYAPHLPALLMQRGHLSEILINLLQNAREAVNGEGRLKICVRGGPENSVVLTVSDNGPGVPADRFEKIFQPYYSTKDKGTGLGLSIVKHN